MPWISVNCSALLTFIYFCPSSSVLLSVYSNMFLNPHLFSFICWAPSVFKTSSVYPHFVTRIASYPSACPHLIFAICLSPSIHTHLSAPVSDWGMWTMWVGGLWGKWCGRIQGRRRIRINDAHIEGKMYKGEDERREERWRLTEGDEQGRVPVVLLFIVTTMK